MSSSKMSVGEELEVVLRQLLLFKRSSWKAALAMDEAEKNYEAAYLNKVRLSATFPSAEHKMSEEEYDVCVQRRHASQCIFAEHRRALLKREAKAALLREALAQERTCESAAPVPVPDEEVDFDGDDFKNWMCEIGCEADLRQMYSQ